MGCSTLRCKEPPNRNRDLSRPHRLQLVAALRKKGGASLNIIAARRYTRMGRFSPARDVRHLSMFLFILKLWRI